MSEMMRLVFVSGLSGAGKTIALKQYEDLGYYCIDNIPLDLIEPLIDHALRNDDTRYHKLALGIDARAQPSEIADFQRYYDTLGPKGVNASVTFLIADPETLLRRYNETRRKHPLSGPDISLYEAIYRERQLLKPIADLADLPIDTTHLNLHELRQLILARQPGDATAGKMTVQLLSFGYKNGTPEDADFIFDARCLRNPHWVTELRPLTGLDAEVAQYLESDPLTHEWYDDVHGYLLRWLPRYQAQDRAYVTIAIGCTGGQHRSTYLVERLGKALREHFHSVVVKHRELWRTKGL
jgi:UPF0042 nucleotide-binding protein